MLAYHHDAWTTSAESESTLRLSKAAIFLVCDAPMLTEQMQIFLQSVIQQLIHLIVITDGLERNTANDTAAGVGHLSEPH